MLTPSASSTSPMTSAAGSTHAPGWMRGVRPGTERTVMRTPSQDRLACGCGSHALSQDRLACGCGSHALSQVRLACGCGSHHHLGLAECGDLAVNVAELSQD